MNRENKNQYIYNKYILKLSSAAGKIGEMIMQNVFDSGFIIDKDRPEDSILFCGYEKKSYLQRPPGWEKLQVQIQKKREEIMARGGYTLKREEVKSVDWVEKWKKYFSKIEVGNNWIIIPSWQAEEQDLVQSKKKYKKRIPLIVKSGVAFGSGHHPSTQLVLTNLAKIKERFPRLESFLDVGCGTGILSLAAGKLGFNRITAVDIDELSIANTRDNMRLNGLTEQIELIKGDIKDMYLPKFDLAAANCLPQIIEVIFPSLISFLKEDSFLILSGFMDRHKQDIIDKVESCPGNFHIHEINSRDSWLAVTIRGKAGD